MINATNPSVSNTNLSPMLQRQDESSTASNANTKAAAFTPLQITDALGDQGISMQAYDANFVTTREPFSAGNNRLMMISPNGVNPNATRENVQGQMQAAPNRLWLDSPNIQGKMEATPNRLWLDTPNTLLAGQPIAILKSSGNSHSTSAPTTERADLAAGGTRPGSPPEAERGDLLARGNVNPASYAPKITDGESLRNAMQVQLIFERQLNTGEYGRALSAAATATVDNTNFYNSIQGTTIRPWSIERKDTAFAPTSYGNPLSIAPYSGSKLAASEQVVRYNQKIDELLTRFTTNPAVKARDLVERARLEQERDKFINDARLAGSVAENGLARQVVAPGADEKKAPIIYINGVNTDRARALTQAAEISQDTGAPVIHVMNTSSMNSLRNEAVRILAQERDPVRADQRIQELLTGNEPAATQTANVIYQQLKTTKGSVNLIGYSQGAAIASNAIRKVEAYLEQKVQRNEMSADDKRAMLGRIYVLGVGPGAALRHFEQRWRNGAPQAIPDLQENRIHYAAMANRNDPIANLVGVRTNTVDVQQAANAAAQLTFNQAESIRAHLSYFRSYEATDPGARYDRNSWNGDFARWYKSGRLSG